MDTITHKTDIFKYREAGLPIMPTTAEKLPDMRFLPKVDGSKSWKPFFNNPPTDEALLNWVEAGCNVAVIVGDNDIPPESLDPDFYPVDCIDFDKKVSDLDDIFDDYMRTVADNDAELAKSLYTERSMSGGYHVFFKTKMANKTKKLTQRLNSKGQAVCIIETKSNNGYVLVAPSAGYEPISGDLCNLPVISPAQRELLIAIALSYSEFTHDQVKQQYADMTNGSTNIGTLYNQKGDHAELLKAHGWVKVMTEASGREKWRRPGKDRGGCSASWDGSHFWCFSSSVPALEPGKPYHLFALRTALENGRTDKEAFKSTVKNLVKEGYGGNEFKSANKQLIDQGFVDETLPKAAVKNSAQKAIDRQESFVHIEDLEDAIAELYQTRYNVVKSRVEVNDGEKWVIADDRWVASIWRKLRVEKFPKLTKQYVNDVLDSDFSKRYHPFKEWFSELPTWDGADYIKEFTNRVAVSDAEYVAWQAYFRRWIIALVACAIDGKPNHSCIVLQGDQSIGKTTWVESLLPAALKEYISKAHFTPNDKDAKIMTAENLIINLDELESSTRDEIGVLKSLITTDSISVRRPYGRRAEILRRTASFIGSVNNTNFLTDQTGSRRFLVVKALTIDNSKPVEHPQLFAQALQAYNEGEKYWFDGAEVDDVNANNKKYQVVASEEELLLKYFRPYLSSVKPINPENANDRARLKRELSSRGSNHALMTFTEIKVAIMTKVPNVKIFDRTLHQVMLNCNFYNVLMSVSNKVGRYYPVVMLSGNEAEEAMAEEEEDKW